MGKGIKQLAAEAAATPITEQIHLPVHISPEAHAEMSRLVRQWTGWRNGSLKFGKTDPKISPLATCDPNKRLLTVDPEHLILNPNRVLLTVTPFRLRQEAVLTGTLLHEAGHARHTHWLEPLMHSDGTPADKQVVALAKVLEEPRVEGLMAKEADQIGAVGLAWTMRAMAAYIMPPTALAADPSQALMDLVSSWVLRAGRQIAISTRMRGTQTPYYMPAWVGQFTSLMHKSIEAHLEARVDAGAELVDDEGNEETANYRSLRCVAALNAMLTLDDDTGVKMVDAARDVLTLLFPETPEDDESDAGDDQAMPADPHAEAGKAAAEEGEGEDESDEPGDGEAEGQPEAEKPGDGGSEGEHDHEDEAACDESCPKGSEADGQEQDGTGQEGASASTPDLTPAQQAALDAMAKALAEMEAQAQGQTEGEAEDEAEKAPPMVGDQGGSGPGGALGGSWRKPSAEEREEAKQAEKFLRDMVDASESSKRTLTDQPSATVDGARLAEWKAGGQVREPHFFVRTRRTVEPSPPVRIAILVDVSSSMDVLQAPSALLSWALANAALDLRNFAGRGQQVESCLIHWGDNVRVIQSPGEVLPGIRMARCNQGTSAMHRALDEVENQMPGFFDITPTPVNRLIVQFTDWKIFPDSVKPTIARLSPALEAGVNMLSVVPSGYAPRYTRLADVLAGCKTQRGANSIVKYNPSRPGEVWSQAANMLSGSEPDLAAAFGF